MEVLESFSPGRTDLVTADGSVTGQTIRGDFSVAGPRGSGDATVVHSFDHTAAVLKDDQAVAILDQRSNAWHVESLSAGERDFLRRFPDADRRQVTEIHRRLSPDQVKIDAFFASLAKLDGVASLTSGEKSNLRAALLNHVAYPAEIYQGRSPTCNVAVVEREMAATQPDRYADFLLQVLDGSRFITPGGRTISFEADNLKMDDTSGRDLASRIFQTAALHMAFSSPKATANLPAGVPSVKLSFRNTADGNGEVVARSYLFDPSTGEFQESESTRRFSGLANPLTAEVLSELTGEDRGPVRVDSAEQLKSLFAAQGNRPLIVTVNGREFPFTNAGPVGANVWFNHVVTVTGVEEGPPMKFLIQNQWGLNSDRSTRATAVDAEDLIVNMTKAGRDSAYAQVIARVPDRTKAYDVLASGQLVEK